jgi:hypothetical protein
MSFKPHVIKQGERWDSISFQEYGDVKYTPEIQNANIEIPLDEPLIAGTIIRIPIKEFIETQNELLPPWKK